MALTASLGREAAKDNVNVNCVCPGIIRTSMWEDILDQMAGSEDATREKVWNACNNVTPNGKPQEPIDIAYMTALLPMKQDISPLKILALMADILSSNNYKIELLFSSFLVTIYSRLDKLY